MCTIGYHKNLNIIFKNRDKPSKTEEEIIVDEKIIACRTRGADYYSWGVNKYGCAFVTTAINAPYWTKLIYEGKNEEAARQYAFENKGLKSPITLISQMLPDIKQVEMWLEALETSQELWMGYNLLVAGCDKAYAVELYRDQHHIRELKEQEVITNHFQFINHGPKKESDYPSTFHRLEYGNERILTAGCLDDVIFMLRPNGEEEQKRIWRDGKFSTISSSVIDYKKGYVHYAKAGDESYSCFSLNGKEKDPALDLEGIERFEMSRYIDLELYHEVERSHPFYLEMVEELREQIRRYCNPEKKYRVLELGAGTGLFTEELVKFPFLEVTALDIDIKCCQVMKRNLRHKNCRVIHGNALTFSKDGYYDIVVTTFAHDHIHYERAEEFARNIKRNLKQGGTYLMGGEILPAYSDIDERGEALYKYHGFIVNKSLKDRNFRVAQIEINALESGLDMVGDFKRHEALFEAEMTGELTLNYKKKIGPEHPEDVGGIFVYVFVRED
jgi:SAM-dependent methyltransferase